MTNFYFDKANAEDRTQRIRQDSQVEQLAAQYKHHQVEKPAVDSKLEKPELIVLRPRYARSIGLSVIIVLIGLMMLMLTTSVAEAQSMEPAATLGGEGGFYEAMLTFTMGNIAFVREDYEKALELMTEAIDMIPVKVFENDPTYGHMYKYLGAVQMELGLVEEALESFTLYIEYAGEDADPEIIQFVEAERS